MNKREKFLIDNIEKLIISNKPGSFQNMFNIPQSNQSLESTQTPQLTGNFISLVHKMYKAPNLIEGPPSETNKSIKSLEEFTPETILSIIEVLRKKIINKSNIRGGGNIILLKTIKDYINNAVNNITPK
jgi:hypothetical protein